MVTAGNRWVVFVLLRTQVGAVKCIEGVLAVLNWGK